MKTTQNQQIRKALESGRKITPMDALSEFGCFRLASRITDLRKQGVKIAVIMRNENGKRFAEYSIIKD